MTLTSSMDVFADQLRDVASAEKQAMKSMTELVRRASAPQLAQVLEQQYSSALQRMDGIARIFEDHGIEQNGDVCKAMAGLIEGGEQHLDQTGSTMTRDLLLIAHSNRIAHYQIAAYDFTRAMAESTGLSSEAQALDQMLSELRGFAASLSDCAVEIAGVPLGRQR